MLKVAEDLVQYLYECIFPPTVTVTVVCLNILQLISIECLEFSLCFINLYFFVDFRGQSVPAVHWDVLKTRWKDGWMNG